MAKSRIPDALQRRDLLEQEPDAAKALRIAEAYLAEDRWVESLAFFAQAEARDRLAELRDKAIETGDAFLLREAALRLGEAPGAEAWQRLADAAEAAGKEHYAAEARRQVAAGEGA